MQIAVESGPAAEARKADRIAEIDRVTGEIVDEPEQPAEPTDATKAYDARLSKALQDIEDGKLQIEDLPVELRRRLKSVLAQNAQAPPVETAADSQQNGDMVSRFERDIGMAAEVNQINYILRELKKVRRQLGESEYSRLYGAATDRVKDLASLPNQRDA